MKREMKTKTKIMVLLAVCFPLLSLFACKKNPIMPDPEELTRPVIWVSTFELSFAAYEMGPNPAAQTIKVKNSGQKNLEYTISDDANWLEVNPAGGSSSGDIREHSVRVNKEGLAARESAYTATVTITCSQAYNNPQRVAVSLKIDKEPPPQISVSPLSLVFGCQVGGSPSPQTISIWNSGKSTLNYTISDDANWLEVEPSSGSSTGETQRRTHTVYVNASGFGQGTYTATITISCPEATNNPQRVDVTLRVAAIPTNNEISVACNPSTGSTGTTVSVPISIYGNIRSISAFGLQLSFDTNMFEYLGTSKGSLTGSWAFVDGNNISGTVTIGGFAGSGNTIPSGSEGSLAVVSLRVTGGSYPNGQQSQLTIRNYTDDIAGMKPEPATTIFTYRK